MSDEKSKKKISKPLGCCLVACVTIFLFFVLLVILAIIGPSQKTYTELQLNQRFEQTVAQSQRTNHLNPVDSIVWDLQEDVAILTMSWEDGQGLTADISVDETGRAFAVSNVQVSEVGILEDFAEATSQEVLESILEEFTKAHRDIVRIEIHTDEVILHFKE